MMDRGTVVNHFSNQGIYTSFMAGKISNDICLYDSQQSDNHFMFNAMYIDGEK